MGSSFATAALLALMLLAEPMSMVGPPPGSAAVFAARLDQYYRKFTTKEAGALWFFLSSGMRRVNGQDEYTRKYSEFFRGVARIRAYRLQYRVERHGKPAVAMGVAAAHVTYETAAGVREACHVSEWVWQRPRPEEPETWYLHHDELSDELSRCAARKKVAAPGPAH